MPTDVIMPQMGESIFEGTITKWLKRAGDRVEKDEPLFEISTDKVDAEIPSPVAGVLTEIKVPEGATVQINAVVAVIGGEVVATIPAPVPVKATPVAVRAPAPTPTPAPSPVPASPAPAKIQAAGAPASHGTEIVMPQMAESIFEGTVTRWLKNVGESVQKDEPLFEISTDKVDAEIPSPVAGVLTEIKVPAGTTVESHTVVAVIDGTAPAPTANAASSHAPAEKPQLAPVRAAGDRIRSSPLVRRIAKENNLDLAYVTGTGSEGRITKEDVLHHLSEHGPGKTAAHAPTTATVAPQKAGQVVPLSRMRAIIAERMVESVRISPHAHFVYKVDMTRVVRMRDRVKTHFEQHNGVKLTYMPFIAAAAIEALRKFPVVNASLVEGFIHYHPNINLGIAVSLEWGLIVPVIHQAEERSFAQLAQAVADLAGRARSKKLLPEEVAGSTFTLTNAGIFGGEFGTPIINQPESAILAIGGLKKEAVVMTDAEGNDTIAIRSMQQFCLGFDHRTIDGADAGRFMAEFKKTLERWDKEIG